MTIFYNFNVYLVILVVHSLHISSYRTSTCRPKLFFEIRLTRYCVIRIHLLYFTALVYALIHPSVRPSLRGSCPLDVAYSSLMDNNELALALRESHLERIVAYLSRAGVQSNPELLAAGYPDIQWDPVEGERFLDFLRFCVWVNGKLNCLLLATGLFYAISICCSLGNCY